MSASGKKTEEQQDSFETRIGRLEEIVEKLEQGDAPLEESLTLFEEGVELARSCQGQLEEARERVEVLLKAAEDGAVETAPFDENEEQ